MLAGVTAIDVSVTDETVSVAEPDLPPNAAVTTAVPDETAVTTPVLAATVATSGALEPHTAAVVMSTSVQSEYVALSIRAGVVAIGKIAAAGFTVTDTSVADVTVRATLLVLPPKLALSCDDPLARPVTTPVVCTTVPTLVDPDVQVT